MKKTFNRFLSIFFLCWSASLAAIQLSLNQERFLPGETLVLNLDGTWSGEADVYVAVSLPGDTTWHFLTPTGFTLDTLPYLQAQSAAGSTEVFRIEALTKGFPFGEYSFYAGITQPNTLNLMDEIIQKPLMYFAAGEDGNIDFPDGLIGRFYSFALAPQAGIRTERFSLSEGTLPVGLTLGEDTGLIQGTPTEGGAAQFTIAATNSEGKVARIKGLIRVWRILTFGEHGTFKDCNGLQMAFNMAQDVDEIRVEQGTYQCDAIEIKGKNWQHGIRVSGGWNSTFENQNLDPVLTVLDGGEKRIANIENSIECEQAGGYWESLSFSCFKKQPSEKPILTISAGPVVIEGLSFQNGHSISGGAILSHTNGDLSITNSIFTNNSASGFGGAISGSSNIINSVFNNNSADLGSGAVSGSNNIINSIFINNSAIECGAVSSVNIINSIFIKNNASKGGAICGSRLIINSTFVNNNASDEGGALEAFYGSGTILNSIFFQNQAAGEANDIASAGELHVDYTLANYISGAVDLGTHFIMGDPRFVDPDNGNFHLLPDSPAINVGDSNVIEDYDFPTNDQGQAIDLEGKLRIIGEGIDLGAYEFQ